MWLRAADIAGLLSMAAESPPHASAAECLSQSQVTPEKGDQLLDSVEVAANEDYANLVQAIVLGLH